MKRVKNFIFWLVVIVIILLLFPTHVIAKNDYRQQRAEMVDIINANVMSTRNYLN